MRIYVTVKQVPDTSGTVAVHEDGTLDRASMQTIINPDDLAAMEQALRIKDATGCQVTAITMGPPPAEGMLRELIAMGADSRSCNRSCSGRRQRLHDFLRKTGYRRRHSSGWTSDC